MPAAVALVSVTTVALIGVGIGSFESAKAHQSSVAAFRVNAATYAERLRAVFQSYGTGLEMAASSVNTRGFSAASLRTGIGYAPLMVSCAMLTRPMPQRIGTQSH
jgi:predicted metalloenzyme YecM